MTIDNKALVKAAHRLALSESGFVFDPMSGQSFTVNPVGLSILRALQKNGSIDATQQYALENFDGDPQDIQRDLDDFYASLNEQLGA